MITDNFEFEYSYQSLISPRYVRGNTFTDRINTDITQLLQRFENILAPSKVGPSFPYNEDFLRNVKAKTNICLIARQIETPDNAYTAVGAYNLNVEATALVSLDELTFFAIQFQVSNLAILLHSLDTLLTHHTNYRRFVPRKTCSLLRDT